MPCLEKELIVFGVHPHAIWYAMKEMKLTQKKTLRYSQRKHRERIKFLQQLREQICQNGSENNIYIDECGFELSTFRPYGYGSLFSKNLWRKKWTHSS